MSDDPLLDDLRRVLDQAEPIPPDSTTLAQAAFGWRTMDAELAELVHDSSVDEPELLLRGSGEAQRVLSFATPVVQIDVEYSKGQLVGQVTPPSVATISVRTSIDIEPIDVQTDEFGAFVVPDVPGGPVLLLCAAVDGSWNARTMWVNL